MTSGFGSRYYEVYLSCWEPLIYNVELKRAVTNLNELINRAVDAVAKLLPVAQALVP